MNIRVIFLIITVFLFSCKHSPKQEQQQQQQSASPQISQSEKSFVAFVSSGDSLIDKILHPLIFVRDSAFKVIRKSPNPKIADSLVDLFRSHYSQSIAAINDSLYENSSFQNQMLEDSNFQSKIALTLASLGCDLVWSEGTVFVDAQSKDLNDNFSDMMSPDFNKYLKIRSIEESEGFSNDAGLLISWDNLSDRIATWEAFASENPSFFLIPEVKFWHNMYLNTYLTGMDNSRIYSFETDTLELGVYSSYKRFLQMYPQTKSASLIKGYIDVLKRNNFKQTKEVDEYLQYRGIESMLGVQPPSR